MARIALVTGGMGGIGEAICFRLTALGYRVVAFRSAGQDSANAWLAGMERQGMPFDAYSCNVSDHASVRQCVTLITREIGAIDILVNDIGITRDMLDKTVDLERRDGIPPAGFEQAFDMSRSVCDGMVARGWGRIINVAYRITQDNSFEQTSYAAAKAGMEALTKAMALELAKAGVTVNTVLAGHIGTGTANALPQDIQERKSDSAQSLSKHLGMPEEVAGLLAYMASDEAAFLTGASIAIQGGQRMP